VGRESPRRSPIAISFFQSRARRDLARANSRLETARHLEVQRDGAGAVQILEEVVRPDAVCARHACSLLVAKFKKDLADSMTWQLLPLGATAPADAVQFMKVDKNATMVAEVEDFITELRQPDG